MKGTKHGDAVDRTQRQNYDRLDLITRLSKKNTKTKRRLKLKRRVLRKAKISKVVYITLEIHNINTSHKHKVTKLYQ